jgi:glyoxylase-like metal-dependent hydrolase (beta-lactamase superfamily II)
MTPAFLDTDRRLGRATALIGQDGGRYPHGNSMLVVGADETVLIDPSLSLVARGGAPLPVDRMLVSHSHEDHLAGVHLHPDASIQVHEADALGVHSLDGLMQVYGMPADISAEWADTLVRDFHYTARPDATTFADGDVIDLGGGVTIEVVHLAGHTRGHSGFLVPSEGVFFCADIDLSAFGPYYGDHWSDLEDFERSLARCRDIDARTYVTFHHKGVVEGRTSFLEQLDTFGAVIARREQALLAYLAEPRTMDEIVAHRFVYRPGVQLLFADHVERRSADLHLQRLDRTGAVTNAEGRWRAT